MLTGSPGSPDRERSGSREVRAEAVRLLEAWAKKLPKAGFVTFVQASPVSMGVPRGDKWWPHCKQYIMPSFRDY